MQKDDMILALGRLGGMATLGQLYRNVDVSKWMTKTPFASIRRIVQTNKEFSKIKSGIWALSSQIGLLNKEIKANEQEFTHAFYQGIIAQIGNFRNFNTFIPAQDKNKLFIKTPLKDITTLEKLPNFTYESIVNIAKNIDITWINHRNMPSSLFEVEHSTDFKNSLNKFYELQDFRTQFFIVADKARQRQFNDIITKSIYKDIKSFVKFADYDSIVKQYEIESIKIEQGI